MALSKLAASASIHNLQTLILGRSDRHGHPHLDSQNLYIAEATNEDDDEEERQNLLQNAAEIQRRRRRRPHHRHHRQRTSLLHQHSHNHNHTHDRPQSDPQRASSPPAAQHLSESTHKPARQSSLSKVWQKLSLHPKQSSSSSSPDAAAAATTTADARCGSGGSAAVVKKKEVRIFLEARPHMNHAIARPGACTPHSASSSLEALPGTSTLVITNRNNNNNNNDDDDMDPNMANREGGGGEQQGAARASFSLNYPRPPTAPALLLPLHEAPLSRAAQDALQLLDLAARQTLMFGDEILYALKAPTSRSAHPHGQDDVIVDVDVSFDNRTIHNNNNNNRGSSGSIVPFATPVPEPHWPVWSNGRLTELAHSLLPRAGGWEMRFRCDAKPWLEFRLETAEEREKFWEWLNEEWDKALPCVPENDNGTTTTTTTTTTTAKNRINDIRSFFFGGSKKDSEESEAQHPQPPTNRSIAKQKEIVRAARREEQARRASEDADPNWVCFSRKKRVMRLDLTVNFVFRAPAQPCLPPRPSQM